MTSEYLTASDVGRLVGVAAVTVRGWADSGRLSAIRTASGIRLFRRADVERIKAEREARRQEA